MKHTLNYQNCRAVITGASGGIGAAMARDLAQRGARVALVARRREQLEELASEIVAAGGQASVFPCDVSDLASIAAAADEVEQAFGGIDLLVNNAGYVTHTLFKDHSLDDMDQMMRTNYLGTVAWMKHALPMMRKQGKGWIVNLSSFAGVFPQVDEAAYSATKAAVTAISEVTAHELAPLGIHVMAVHPVLVRSDMFTDEVMARMPRGIENTFVEADEFCRLTLRALERGRNSIIIPGKVGIAQKLKGLFPGLVGRAAARHRLAVLTDVTD